MRRKVQLNKAFKYLVQYGYSAGYPVDQKTRNVWGWVIAVGAIDVQKANAAAPFVEGSFDKRTK